MIDLIKSTTYEIPFMDLSVPAGFPSPAGDHAEQRINLNNFLIAHPESTFVVRCSGNSMINAFIPPLCLLLVDRSIKAENGDIVLAYINGEFTVKYWQVNDRKCKLIPANRKYQEIEVTEDSDLIIWGVVINIISKPREFRHVWLG